MPWHVPAEHKDCRPMKTITVLYFSIFLVLQIANGQTISYATSNSPVCAGSTIELKAACGQSFVWTAPNGWTSTQQNLTITNMQMANAGTYNLTMWDNEGVIHSASVVVVVNPIPVANAGMDVNCSCGFGCPLSGSASGGAGGPYNFHWDPAEELVNANVQNPLTVWSTTATKFYLTVIEQSTGCSSRKDSANVNIYGCIGCSVSSIPSEICQGGFAHIKTQLFFDTIDHIYNWTSNPPGVVSSYAEFNVNPTVTTTYYLETHSSWFEFYHAYDTVTVTVLNTAPQYIGGISGPETVCKGLRSIQYSVQPVPDASSYQWSLPAGVTGQSTTSTITVDVGQDAVSGNIGVAAQNACGLSPGSTKAITFNTCPVEVKLDTFISCVGNQVIVPVKVKNFRDIGKFSLSLNYDSAKVSFTAYQSINAGIEPLSVTNTAGIPSTISISSTTPFGSLISDGEQLVNLVFTCKNGLAPLVWSTTALFNSTFYSPCGELLPATLINGLLRSGVQLFGIVRYNNVVNSPLHSVNVTLKQNGVIKGEVVTDQNGLYSFPDVCPGNYTVQAHSTQPWGGCNSIDALLILKHFVEVALLDGLSLQAAETDNSGYINSADALLVLKRFTGLSSSFPAGDWVFEEKAFTVPFNGNSQIDLKGLCKGDVNGSFVPEVGNP